MKLVDLFIGVQWAEWVIENVSPKSINSIFCSDQKLSQRLASSGFEIAPKIKGEFGLAVHWQAIFKPSQIEQYSALLNIHPGLIPQSRGTYPVFWDLLEFKEIGVSVHQVTSVLDFGPYLFREKISYSQDDGMSVVAPKVRLLEEQLFLKTLDILWSGEPFFTEVSEKDIGTERKRADFLDLRDNGPGFQISDEQRYRLILAFEHPEFKLPRWLKG